MIMKEIIKELIIWLAVILLMATIGAGIAILVVKAIETTKAEACFDYKDSAICEEVINKAKKHYEKN